MAPRAWPPTNNLLDDLFVLLHIDDCIAFHEANVVIDVFIFWWVFENPVKDDARVNRATVFYKVGQPTLF